jgi:NitT/TauT family transport system substrate-binding protein
VLQFGTINWEMSLIQQMKLDAKHGFTLEVVPVASKNAAAVALQAGAVDVILTDIFWVLHQYNAGKDYVIMPTHKATGGIYARAQSADSFSLNDLSGRRLGVAGGSTDKNYIILNAFAKAEDTSLANVDVKFAAPPLLKRMLEQEQIDYSINFWHYNARLAAQGFVNVLPLTTMLERLDINTDVPLLGWVASAAWLAQNNHIFSGFVAASAAAKQRLVKDQSAWEAVRHLTKAESNEIFASLIAHYPQTLLTSFDRSNQQAFASLVSRLADAQQVAFLGEITHIPQDIYWQSAIGVWEQRGNNP